MLNTDAARYDLAKSAPSYEPTLADVLVAIDKESDFPPQRREDLKSAVRTLARIIGRRPEEVPAVPAKIRDLVAGFHPVHVGISHKRWRNIRAAVNTSLTLIGIKARRRVYQPLKDPRWQGLWDALPCDLHRRHRLIKFMRYCDDLGLAPTDITDETLCRFRDHLEAVFLTGDPQSTVRETAIGWNLAARSVAGWPNIQVTAPSGRDTYSISRDTLPRSFHEDVERWLKRMRLDDPLDDAAPNRPLKPATLMSRENYMYSFASALARQGRDPATITRLADLVASDAFSSALTFFYSRHGNRWSPHAHNLAKCMTAIAEHYVDIDAVHLAAMKKLTAKTRPPHRGMTRKNRKRLRQFDDAPTKARFVKLPEILVRLSRKAASPRTAAQLTMWAVAIEILTFCPIRLKNLVGLHLDRSFGGLDRKRGGTVHLTVAGEETKNEEELVFELRPETVRLLRLYVRDHRHRLTADPANRHLFPAEGTGPRNQTAFSTKLGQMIFRHSGIDISTHVFRHAVGKIYLDAHPGQYEAVRRLLGHKDIRTTVEHYTGEETAAAARRYADIVLGLRVDAGRPRRRPRSTARGTRHGD